MKGKQETKKNKLNTEQEQMFFSTTDERNKEPLHGDREFEKRIAKWLDKLHFRKQFFGGVSEGDVWKKIAELHGMYEDALKAEQIRYDTMIEHYKQSCEAMVANMAKQEQRHRENVEDE